MFFWGQFRADSTIRRSFLHPQVRFEWPRSRSLVCRPCKGTCWRPSASRWDDGYVSFCLLLDAEPLTHDRLGAWPLAIFSTRGLYCGAAVQASGFPREFPRRPVFSCTLSFFAQAWLIVDRVLKRNRDTLKRQTCHLFCFCLNNNNIFGCFGGLGSGAGRGRTHGGRRRSPARTSRRSPASTSSLCLTTSQCGCEGIGILQILEQIRLGNNPPFTRHRQPFRLHNHILRATRLPPRMASRGPADPPAHGKGYADQPPFNAGHNPYKTPFIYLFAIQAKGGTKVISL